jgi:hypothetical protein
MLIWSSSLGILCLALYWAIQSRNPRPFVWALVILAIVLGMFISTGLMQPPWREDLVSRGESQGLLILVLYVVMVAGMLAHYMFFHQSRPKKQRRKIDFSNLLAPVFVSPIVFLPLASVLDSIGGYSTSADTSRLVLFLVAFENGFFWQEFFQNRRKVWDGRGGE